MDTLTAETDTLTAEKDQVSKIGLEIEKSRELANHLNNLLANYSVFYQNVRGYHWNVQGDNFFTLHEKFEELYDDLFVKIDEIAERALTLGFHPDHNFTTYLKISEIPESHEVKNGQKAVEEILSAFKTILQKQRTILNLSDLADDEGTNALMSDYITEQEKLVWMYTSFLKDPEI
ncbi:MAG: DNA starvation/stationary phase protection protein [Balneolaceae bacterium]|nr:DNA starvation/stationary phase protection protein [Balneolaceae bacterium]MBO6547513.1 DNA starvation/stationary phase protection protein [Balneolaceae bacterium]MBO6647540.1 DNA starvation/stationary phase protection protein [Balneolaceae bacterium]